ncbi:glycosyltransferase [Hydrogenophaga sp.]|uniref:glycosyltransferase n=1 Tax=Hydrogenophaga sp. TaxID=1904254 RepID=UPI0027317290|nr:glycosyltransferase [Hydrogenophaga sp.]MDP2073001.1 glycosyltransferase [Hydrogenophaga sp.]
MTQNTTAAREASRPRVIVHAPNVHQGGGATLLRDLLTAPNGPDLAFIDARMRLPETVPSSLKVVRVAPSLRQRWKAEAELSRICRAEDVVLCFGNLPPLHKSRGKVFVYLQNRYLSAHRSLKGLPLKAQVRIHLERLWLRRYLRDATVIVQTETMAQEVRQNLHRSCEILPFAPRVIHSREGRSPLFDFVYVASGEPHKNHRNLIEAWVMLAQKGMRPTLCLTLDESNDAHLLDWIRTRQTNEGLNIHNRKSDVANMPALYAQSLALIFPSLFESFGLPLIEARDAGLPILASELDYVRDVIEPHASFDPSSALSISRAVMRHLGRFESPAGISVAAEFWQKLRGMS